MIRWCYRYHRTVLLVVVLLTVAACAVLWRVGLRRDYRLEAFVASSDQSYERFRAFMDEFTSNELALIAIECEDALSAACLSIQEELLTDIEPLEKGGQVEHVGALARIPPAFRNLLGDFLTEHPLIDGNLISHDGRTAAIVLQMRGEGASGAERRKTVQALRAAVAHARESHPEVTIMIAGPYVTLIDMYRYVDRDLVVFSLAAFALLMLTLALVFRRLRPMVFAMLAALAALAVTLAVVAVLQVNASLIIQMIVILVMVLTVANAVHLAVGAEETALEDPSGSREGWSLRTFARLGWPCTAVIATTAAGFASVTISDISPVRLFGQVMVLGLVVGLLFTLLLVPVILPRVTGGSGDGEGAGGAGTESAGARTEGASAGTGIVNVGTEAGGTVGGIYDARRLRERLAEVGAWSLRRSKLVVALFVIGTAAALSGWPRLHFESDFVKNFRAGSEVRTAYEFIEQHLTPLGSLEVVVRAPKEQSVATLENAEIAEALGRRLVQQHEPVKKAMTLADLVTLGEAGLPESDVGFQLRLAGAERMFGDAVIRSFLNADRSAMRINLRAAEGHDVGEKLRMAASIEKEAKAAFGPGFTTEVTGLYYFYAQLVEGLVNDQYRSFALTVPIVFLMLAAVFRSLKIAALSMIPNLLPAVLCVGVMAWLAIPVNMTTAMMLSVTFGIAVDDTLHYFWRCRREFERCGTYAEAVARAHASVGRACLFTTVVIAGGFWVLVLSRFLPTAYFGGLVGFTMVGALAADLVLLPVIIRRFEPFGAERVTARHGSANSTWRASMAHSDGSCPDGQASRSEAG